MKYVLHPGYIISKVDGDRHYVYARDLARLYDINYMECRINMECGSSKERYSRDDVEPGAVIHLYPDPTGQYQLPRNGIDRAIRRLKHYD